MRKLMTVLVLLTMALSVACAQTQLQPDSPDALRIINSLASVAVTPGVRLSVVPVPNFPGRAATLADFGKIAPGPNFNLKMHAVTGDVGYFNGATLFDQIGKKIYGIPAATLITDKVNPNDPAGPLAQTYYDIYAMPLAASTPPRTAATVQDTDITEDDLKNVVQNFPWSDPRSCQAISKSDFTKLMQAYYGFIGTHMSYQWITLASPFLLKGITGNVLSSPTQLLGTLLPGAIPGAPAPLTVTTDPATGTKVYSGFINDATPPQTDNDFYRAEMTAQFYFQQFPSTVPIDMGGGPPPTAVPLRLDKSGAPSLDGMPIAASATSLPAGLDEAFLTGTIGATGNLPPSLSPQEAGFPPRACSCYYAQPSPQITAMTPYELDPTKGLAGLPSVTYGPPGDVAFFPGHDPANLTATQMDEAAMEVYLYVDAKLYHGTTAAAAAAPGTPMTELHLIDRVAVLSYAYGNVQFTDVDQFNSLMASNACNSNVAGDPLGRPVTAVNFPKITPDPTGATPAAAAFPVPGDTSGEDKFLQTLNAFSQNPIPGDPQSKGNVYAVFALGRGPAFNYVYEKTGEPIDPSKGDNPLKYWDPANIRHIVAVWPYQTHDDKGNTFVIGPFIGKLAEHEDPTNPSSLPVLYKYAQPPFHSDTDPDKDHCQPVCLGKGTSLLKAVNAIYENHGSAQVHMTATFSPWFNSPNNGFNYSADIFFQNDDKTDNQSLYVVVQPYQADANTNPNLPAIQPLPPGFVPLLPSFPVVQQNNVPNYTKAGGGTITPASPFIGSFDAATTDFKKLQNAATYFDPPARDQYVALKVVNGCGAKTKLSETSCGGAMTAKPTAAVTIKDPQQNTTYTAGVPIRSTNWIYDLGGTNQLSATPIPQYAPGSNTDSLSSRVNGGPPLNYSSNDFDGSLATNQTQGNFINPGSQFFAVPDKMAVKGHRLLFDVCAESQVPPGLDVYTFATTGRANYIPYIKTVTMKVFPPGSSSGEPENQFTIYDRSSAKSGKELESGNYDTAAGEAASADAFDNAAPPCSEVPYVFRDAGQYIVEVDTTDFSGNTRLMRIPINVHDEGASVNKISGETEKKN